MNTLKRLLKDEDGGTAVEYGLVIALVAVGLNGTFQLFGSKISTWFGGVGDEVTQATPDK
jgi:pilus assembly protein Flp/PilA